MIEQSLHYANRLLKLMTEEDVHLLRPHLEPVMLETREVLEAAHEPIRRVYFPEDGLVSVVATLPRGRDMEVGIIGRDGMTGTAFVQHDDRSPHTTIVQAPGAALVMEPAALRDAMDRSPTLTALLHRYARALTMQIASTALANGRSKLEERLARWLVMVQDRLDTDRFAITHEFLSVMLGVRRPGVTVAMHILEGKGLIRSVRGAVQIKDRDGLIELADGAYGMAEGEYRRLLGIRS
ncbi:Crp/Fnr family transcriptional regulator [Arsenicitalea aurantiaca]|uniref:Crp/Fnr family transcriptional regulator n=1 Tax=Arsenicitalea aurantiaca TaxID=1783274 RepID=A0A433XBL2_9HYPH|nr:Crp/Fnr family transcriptional regulator [Arsenicitalea aurantiaca]